MLFCKYLKGNYSAQPIQLGGQGLTGQGHPLLDRDFFSKIPYFREKFSKISPKTKLVVIISAKMFGEPMFLEMNLQKFPPQITKGVTGSMERQSRILADHICIQKNCRVKCGNVTIWNREPNVDVANRLVVR
jgi:hypothetical protein